MTFTKVMVIAVILIVPCLIFYATEMTGQKLNSPKRQQTLTNYSKQETISTIMLRNSSDIASPIFAVHDRGYQCLVMANNYGVLSNPNNYTIDQMAFAPQSSKRNSRLVYPCFSGTTFLFSGGLWVGVIKNGQKITSTVADGDDGTREFGPLAYAEGVSWLYQSKNNAESTTRDKPTCPVFRFSHRLCVPFVFRV